jgi:general L-amino acid transport system substrate-binding protein
MRTLKFATAVLIIGLLFCGSAMAGQTLDTIKGRGFINVGVSEGLAGFAMPDEKGVWRGLDVDTARAISCAVFGAPDKIKFIPLTSTARFTALQSGEVDVLCRNVTTTLSRDTALGLDFAHVNYYDGQAFMVPKDLGVKSVKELDGASVCVLPGSTTELNLADYFSKMGMKYEPVVIRNQSALQEAFYGGRCDCITSDSSQLAGMRVVAPDPSKYVILPEIISKEPLAPCVRHGDNQWGDIVNWTVQALIQAEELGISSKNIEKMSESDDPKIKRFMSVSEGAAKALGLEKDWARDVIAHVGNYGEIFERNVGKNTPLGLERGLNALWTEGGLMYSPPFR